MQQGGQFMNNQLKKIIFRWESALVLLLVIEVIVFGILNPKFLQVRVLLGSINDFIPICIIALFVTMVMITGGIDIQAGAIVGLTSIFIGLMWKDLGVNIWVASFLSLLVGGLCGALSGFFVAYTGVQPMVITLGGQFLFSGLAIVLTKLSATESYKGISGFPQSFTDFSKGHMAGIPNQVVVYVVLIVMGYLLLHRTKYGRSIFLCGVNRNAAEYSGLKTSLIVMSTYILSGISASVAGVLMTGYLGTAKADFGKELTLPIITAVVLGGTSNNGGKGGVIGTALATIVVGTMRFGLSMAGMNTQYLDMPVGILLIVAVAVRTVRENPKILQFITVRRRSA